MNGKDTTAILQSVFLLTKIFVGPQFSYQTVMSMEISMHMLLTRKRFFRLGKLRPAVVVSLLPLSSSVCNLCSMFGSIPLIDGIILSANNEPVLTHIVFFRFS